MSLCFLLVLYHIASKSKTRFAALVGGGPVKRKWGSPSRMEAGWFGGGLLVIRIAPRKSPMGLPIANSHMGLMPTATAAAVLQHVLCVLVVLRLPGAGAGATLQRT